MIDVIGLGMLAGVRVWDRMLSASQANTLISKILTRIDSPGEL